MPSSSRRGNVFGEGFGAADVGDGDLGSAATQKEGRGQAGFAQSDDENFFAFELHHEVQSKDTLSRRCCGLAVQDAIADEPASAV